MADTEALQNAETEETSQVEQTQEGEVHEEVIEQDSPPEVEDWQSLSGSTQERIVKLVRRAKEAEEKLSQTKQPAYDQVIDSYQHTQTDPYDRSEVQKAISVLKTNGVATIEDIRNEVGRLETQRTHESLSRKYDGSDGNPRYISEEVEDYARRNNIWNLESAFKDMYFDEFMDSARRGTKRRRVTTATPSAPAGKEEPMTMESFRAKLRNPDGSLNMAEYDKLTKDPGQFDALLKQLNQ